MAALLAESFVVEPGAPLLLTTLLWFALLVTAGAVTAAKGRWLWLLFGLLLACLPWLVAALLPARPGSLWDRRLRASRRA